MGAKNINKIALIYPPYGERVPTPSTISPPMGLCSLAAVLLKENFRVKIIDANVEELDYNQIVNRLKEDPPDAIGISCIFTAFYNSTRNLAARVKQELGIPIVVGGNQATAMSEYLIQDENIDFIICGEGEIPLPNLLRSLNGKREELKGIKGLIFREGQRIISTPKEEYIKDLDEIPLPPYHLFPMERYSEYNLSCTRGCPFDCTYCASKVIFGRRLRMRSLDNVIEELELLVSHYGVKSLVFYDDFFTARREYVLELMDKMIEKNWGLKWRCATRVNAVSADIILKMKEAGCELMKYGVESGSPQILRTIKKGIGREEIKDTLEVTRAAHMPYSAFFMIGNRDENLGTVKESFRLIKELNIEQVSFAITVPLPGTELAESLIRDGLLDLDEIDWDIMLPIRLISRDYERYSAKLASRWCAFSPDEIIEYAEIGKKIGELNYLFNISGFSRYAKETNIFRALLRYLQTVLAGLKRPKLFLKSIRMYLSL